MPPVGAGAFTTETFTLHSAPATSIVEYTQIPFTYNEGGRPWDKFLVAYLVCLGETRISDEVRLAAVNEVNRWIGDSIYDC